MAPAKANRKYVALLRGINVAGKNMLPMQDLANIFRDSGCTGVSTFINSGNVIFSAGPDAETTLPDQISQHIEDSFGYRIPVVLRNREELQRAIAANPFLIPGVDEKALHVYFLRDNPGAAAIASLDPERSLPDTFAVVGGEIYLNLPNGMARTKLTNAWFDSKLKTVSTARNWNTTQKLLELLGG
jgi:uncharacterized protein (DUF1697 family)